MIEFKLYEVKLTVVAYIAAPSEQAALAKATSTEKYEIYRNEDPYVEVTKQVTSLDAIGHGWDGECLAYGLSDDADMSLRRVIEG